MALSVVRIKIHLMQRKVVFFVTLDIIRAGSVTKLESHICSFLAAGCVMSLFRELIVTPAPAVTVG